VLPPIVVAPAIFTVPLKSPSLAHNFFQRLEEDPKSEPLLFPTAAPV
jgi:hypothetical protein